EKNCPSKVSIMGKDFRDTASSKNADTRSLLIVGVLFIVIALTIQALSVYTTYLSENLAWTTGRQRFPRLQHIQCGLCHERSKGGYALTMKCWLHESALQKPFFVSDQRDETIPHNWPEKVKKENILIIVRVVLK
ncbi:MAG TPA: hypothetical protein VH593_27195, partial [Ktedonobacteraceae bacterium]